MKEYIKLFNGINSADGYNINDIPFTSTVKLTGDNTNVNLRCNKTYSKIIVEDGEPKVSREVTITNTWDPSLTDKDIKVIISGNVDLCGKTDCYSIEFEEGGHLTINPDARLRIWEGGIVNADAESVSYFTIKSAASGDEAFPAKLGQFLLHPNITVNNQPKAVIELYTKCYQTGANPWTYKWQRFAIPVLNIDNTNKPTNNYTDQALFGSATTFKTYLYKWDGSAWVQPSNGWTSLKPSKGYQISNNTVSGGITYTFHGNIKGNVDNIKLSMSGMNYMGNSFIAPISVSAILNQYNSIILWVNEQAITITDTSIYKTIPPLSAFIIENPSQQEIDFGISYKDLVWDPSFEEESVPIRSLSKGGSSPKSDVPDLPIFKALVIKDEQELQPNIK